MKKKNEDIPENLDGLGDMLPAEVLKKLKELLETLHHAEANKEGSTVIYIYEKGSQHIDTQINIETLPKSETHPSPPCAGREKSAKDKESFNADTPLSDLFRENHHEELRKVIESWRPYLNDDNPNTDVLAMTHFEFDKDRIYSNKAYRDLCELDALGALQVSLSQLARYLSEHSNLSQSYATLYQQLKDYRAEHMTYST